MGMHSLHVCIITGQPLANLIPLLQERPETICLVHSDDMHEAAQAFSHTLEQAGFSPSQILVRGALPTHPYDEIRLFAMGLRDDLGELYPDARLTWHATGGTKMMALAFWDVLYRDRDRVIYTETRDGVIEELIPESGAKQLESVLTPELYLDALGKLKRRADSDREQWCESAVARKQATRFLAENAEALGGLIQLFNRSLDADAGQLQHLRIERAGGQWRSALTLRIAAGPQPGREDGQYHTVRSDSARYLTGGWLEEYVWYIATQQGLDFVQSGLKFGDRAHRKEGQDNEIDTFIMHRNRLLLVECKSGYLGRDARKDGDIIYKLDSIGLHAGGTQATKLLIAAQPLQHETKAGRKVDTRARATATGIYTLECAGLKKLGENLRYWRDQGRWQGIDS
jgi:hypothetical protein